MEMQTQCQVSGQFQQVFWLAISVGLEKVGPNSAEARDSQETREDKTGEDHAPPTVTEPRSMRGHSQAEVRGSPQTALWIHIPNIHCIFMIQSTTQRHTA